jgi:hypothetical protein
MKRKTNEDVRGQKLEQGNAVDRFDDEGELIGRGVLVSDPDQGFVEVLFDGEKKSRDVACVELTLRVGGLG